VLIHGGGWIGGCRENLDPEAVTLRENGFLVFTVDWPLACAEDSQSYAPEVLSLCGWPWQKQAWETGQPHAAVQDVEDAVSWVKAHAASYWSGWNGKVAALGSSAGGTALLEGIADTAQSGEPLVDVAATWSAKIEFGEFVDHVPTDHASRDTCDHSKVPTNCWWGVDSYLNSVDSQGKPVCGFPIDQEITDPCADGITDPSWLEASPHKEWDLQSHTGSLRCSSPTAGDRTSTPPLRRRSRWRRPWSSRRSSSMTASSKRSTWTCAWSTPRSIPPNMRTSPARITRSPTPCSPAPSRS